MRNRSILIFCMLTAFLLFIAGLCVTVFVPAKGVSEETLDKQEMRITANKTNWARLLKGMEAEEAKSLLGEPDHVIEGVEETWCYQKGGTVRIVNGKVTKWVKPFSWDY